MEKLIVDYLNKYGKGYTKPLYRELRVKDRGYSLNEFRNILFTMSVNKLICYNKETKVNLPYWSSLQHD